jgi:hypothetical protein
MSVLHLVVGLEEVVTAFQYNCRLFAMLCPVGDTVDPSFGCSFADTPSFSIGIISIVVRETDQRLEIDFRVWRGHV